MQVNIYFYLNIGILLKIVGGFEKILSAVLNEDENRAFKILPKY